ncbi:MAG: UDP-4-amino-4,6-dideoxy-N-acetyl-beta-L-altrosamine transaminase [Culturomica sp.]|nr:UDP-4-amino-4,6-dideoxy-N-acetyl-beta-L-altrosamine transaminase [Culturomica sp.]
MKPIFYGRHYIAEEDIQAVHDTLLSDFLAQGPRVEEFETKFAAYVGAKYAVAVMNGTAALHLSALVLGVNEKSKVITTPITFAASANCIRYCGGEVVFSDIDPQTALIDIPAVEKLVQQAPAGTYQGIIPVDFAGYPVDMEHLRKVADTYGLWIIEDACHAPGGYFVDSSGTKQLCGNGKFSDLTVFSFHPVKHITTGEGGMITTNNESLYRKLLLLRSHGITKEPDLMSRNDGGWYYEMQTLGHNYRLPEMNAALGISQLKRAEAGIKRRLEIAKRYDEAFEGVVESIKPSGSVGHAYHLYILKVSGRKKVYDTLREKGIFTQIHYIPVHTLPYYRSLGYKTGSLPHAEQYYRQCLSIPMYPSMTDEQVEYVIRTIKEVV